jgi:hypothetical protein
MIRLELVCLAIVLVYVASRLVRGCDRAGRLGFVARFVALSVASFIGEDTVIRAHCYYAYAPGWSVRLDRVPLVIVLVWPVVIDSAAMLARALAGDDRSAGSRRLRVATLGAAIVLADASLIEPIAVRAGLWHWTEPGLFDVPLIGIVGWAFFAWAAIFVLESTRTIVARSVALVLVAPIATHALIVMSWWSIFRWTQGARSGAVAAALAWVVTLALAARIARARARARRRASGGIPISELLLRLPGASFFFVLLTTTAPPPALVAYAVAFAPPYLVGIWVVQSSRRIPSESR